VALRKAALQVGCTSFESSFGELGGCPVPAASRWPLPVFRSRCQIRRRTIAYRPGSLGEVLTEHYRRARPEALGFPSR
jgi:hypothetical protein